MNEIKLRASFSLRGTKLLSEEEAEKLGLELNTHSVTVYNGKTKTKETTVFHTKAQNRINQTVNMDKSAYIDMVSSTPPVGVNKFIWNKYSKNQRIKYHLEQIASDLGGTLLDFAILDE